MGDRRHPSPRRQFLRTSALAGAAVSLGGPAWPRPAAGNAVAEGEPLAPSWIDRPMRWAQLTLVEDDPGSSTSRSGSTTSSARTPTPPA